MDSYSIAKDFEALCVALGDEKLNYLGWSYGTIFGQAYAELFPDKIRAMALDGNIDHSLSETETLTDEVASYENELHRFAAWCKTTPSCPLHGEDVLQLFANLTATADEMPIPAPACQQNSLCFPNVTSEEIRFNFQLMLAFNPTPKSIDTGGWSNAAIVLKQATAGNATALSTSLAQNSKDPTIWQNGIATLCQDWNHTATTLADLVYKEQLTSDLAPYTQGACSDFYIQSACIGWPEPVRYIPHTINITDTPTILLTNAYHDPATPNVEANGLLGQIENAVLATRKGDGHTSYLLLGDTYRAINEILVDLKIPAPNTVFNS